MAMTCLANWIKNRSFHCAITGPLFLIAVVAFLLEGVGVIHINTHLVWRFVLVGIGLAFPLELHPFGFQPKGWVILATRTLILTRVFKTAMADCRPRNPAHEAGALLGMVSACLAG